MNEIEFKSIETGTLLRGRFITDENHEKEMPLIIMLTGDGPKGSKSLSWVNMPPLLSQKGISSFLFDFEGLGYSDGDRKQLTVSKGIDNLRSAWETVQKQNWVDKNRIGFFASSFGATTLLLSPEIANQSKAIGLKSPASFIPDAYFNEIGSDKFDIWRKKLYLEDNGYDFNIFLDALQHNAFSTASDISTACLITQGDNDEVIPVQQSTYLYEVLQSKEKELIIFPGASHGYGEGDSWEKMATSFVTFFQKYLCNR